MNMKPMALPDMAITEMHELFISGFKIHGNRWVNSDPDRYLYHAIAHIQKYMSEIKTGENDLIHAVCDLLVARELLAHRVDK